MCLRYSRRVDCHSEGRDALGRSYSPVRGQVGALLTPFWQQLRERAPPALQLRPASDRRAAAAPPHHWAPPRSTRRWLAPRPLLT
ncbi:uncharacterized protein LOC116756832 isoform X3 [Phocoena sinus]|uniref:uncharacterized protein LOC116756832 isoform X3 n=1 Tax=Phocoena sinus TaxID=42100 RepID=UPI0013C49037|nr:uncharacterized protein LOC116756832 isoform X3 [Phocoena sinus]